MIERIILSIITAIVPLSSKIPNCTTIDFAAARQLIELHEHFKVICMVESGGNALAVHKSGLDVGIAQIRPILVKDVNRIAGVNYSLSDRFCKEKSFEMFMIYCEHYGANTLEERALLWHIGASRWKEKKESKIAKNYIRKVKYYHNVVGTNTNLSNIRPMPVKLSEVHGNNVIIINK